MIINVEGRLTDRVPKVPQEPMYPFTQKMTTDGIMDFSTWVEVYNRNIDLHLKLPDSYHNFNHESTVNCMVESPYIGKKLFFDGTRLLLRRVVNKS